MGRCLFFGVPIYHFKLAKLIKLAKRAAHKKERRPMGRLSDSLGGIKDCKNIEAAHYRRGSSIEVAHLSS